MKPLPLVQLIANLPGRDAGRGFGPVVRLASIAIAASVVALAAAPASAQQVTGSYVGDMAIDGEVIDGGVVSDGNYVGDCIGRSYGRPDLFYNYYTQGYCNRANAQMYISPLPVPPNVGHTYNTYQPFYPHHMMYWHKDRYHRYYDNGRGMNRTRAVYYSPPIKQAVSNIYWNCLRLPR